MSTATIVHVSLLHPHPGNIRADLGDLAELAASIRAHGIVQPLVVQRHPQNPGHYLVIAGHRRLEAAKKARLNEVPVVIRTAPLDSLKATEVMLVENCQRRDLGPIEKAEAMGRLLDAGYSQAQIAKTTGLSQSTISYHLSLLYLDEASRERVRAGQVPAAEAVTAVRSARARTPAPKRRPRLVSVAPDGFSAANPLSQLVRTRCRTSGHTARKYGGLGCAACWEAVIREDERRVTTALAEETGIPAAVFRAPEPAGVPS